MKGHPLIKGVVVTLHRGRRDVRLSVRFLFARWKSVTAALLLVLVAEFVVRTIAPGYVGRVYDQRRTAGHPIEMNPEGYRGSRVTVEKPEGVYRVIAFGDSVTFGTGVRASETWPAQLERELEERTGRDVQVINTGVPAIDLRQMRLQLREVWSSYEPDAIVVMLSGNAVSLSWIRRDDEVKPPRNPYRKPPPEPTGLAGFKKKASHGFKQLALPAFLNTNVERLTYWVGVNDHRVPPEAPFGAMLAHGWRQADLDPSVPEEAWSITGDNLRVLVDDARASGLDVLVSGAPSRFSISDRLVDNEKNVPKSRLTIDPPTRTREICAGIGVPYSSIEDELRAHKDGSLYVLSDYTHFNATGAGVIARRLADDLVLMMAE